MSSANKEIRWSLLPILMPDIPACDLTATAKGSIYILYSGDKGHPCLVDHFRLKGFEILLLDKICAADLYIIVESIA